jgi:hypothetical protein
LLYRTYGHNALFWDDVWPEEIPLKLAFPRIYAYFPPKKKNLCIFTEIKKALVRECWGGEDWIFDFVRSFGMEEVTEWEWLLENYKKL